MGNEPLIPVVKSLPHEPETTDTNPESDESYFRGLQVAYILSRCYPLSEDTPSRGVLYGIRERHPEGGIFYAVELEKSISKELELLREAREMNQAAVTLIEEDIIRMLREQQTRYLEEARMTLEYEVRLLQLLKPDGLYVEGIPVRAHLENMMPIYLDEDSEAYHELIEGHGCYLELQKKRERKDWLTKISGSIRQFQKPLIIAGPSHLENKFGLVDLLSEKGIRLHILNPRQE